MRVIVIPDTQIKTGVNTDHIEAIGNYIVDKKPEVVVALGDWFDMPSLSTHNDRGHIAYENARMQADLEAGWAGMDRLLQPLFSEQRRQKKNRKAYYNPRMEFLYGNHEYRRTRLMEQEPFLEGALPDYDLHRRYGWVCHEFLSPIRIAGVAYCHYAQGGVMGRPIGRAQLIGTKKHESWVVGHQQGLDIYISPHTRSDGSRVQCIISGSFYQHDESYMGPQGNQHWRGALMLTEVQNGTFDFVTLSVNFLMEKWL